MTLNNIKTKVTEAKRKNTIYWYFIECYPDLILFIFYVSIFISIWKYL